jgi:hypothetical protein
MNLKTLNFKSILKRTLYVVLLLILLFCAWLAFVVYHEEYPDSGRDEFYATNQAKIPDNQNLAIAITGLNALEGKDSIEHGRFITDASNKDLTRDVARFIANGPAKLNFVGKRDELECWLDEKLIKTANNCASPERLKALILANKTLYSRYQQLYTLPHWQGNTFGGGQTIIDINVLLAAEIMQDIDEGRQELAYQKWRDNFLFINRAIAAQSTMIDRAIFLVADSLSLKSVVNILLESPEINTQHFDELQVLLKPNDLERYNIKDMLGADYEFVNNQFVEKQQTIYYVHPNFIRNRIYRMHKSFYDSTQKLPSTLDMASEQFGKQYHSQGLFNINWLDPFNSFLANKIAGGLPSGFSLIKAMHHHNATINALNLLTQIRVKNIESANIQDFINLAGAEFNNPFTEKPLQWDAEKAAIIYENPSLEENVAYKL